MPSGNRPTRDPHTRSAIHTLERLHSELGGQILENRQKHQELSDQMRQVEAVIKLLAPGYNLAGTAVKRRKPQQVVQARHALQTRPRRDADGYGADDGKRDRRGRAGGSWG